MFPALRSPALPNWRTVCIAAACAAAGGGLRWGFREHDAVRADSALTAPPAPVLTKPPVALSTHLTAESRRSLSNLNKLTALAAILPNMTAEEIAPLVETLAASVQEGGSGWGTPESTEIMLRALFTRWAELDAPG